MERGWRSAALKLSWRYVEAFESEAAQLYAQAMELEQMRDFAMRLVDVEGADSATSTRNCRERAGAIVKLWTSSPTIAPIAGTRWAAYNAVTEYVDHYIKVRAAGDDQTARALRAVTIGSSAQSMKAETFRMLQAL